MILSYAGTTLFGKELINERSRLIPCKLSTRHNVWKLYVCCMVVIRSNSEGYSRIYKKNDRFEKTMLIT